MTVNANTWSAITLAMSSYINSIASSKRYSASFYTVKDIRQKLGSGVGSLGKLRYYVFLEGPSSSTSDDVILEMKQTIVSSVATAGKLNTAASYLGVALASAHALADQDYDASIVSYSIDKQVADAVTSKSSLKAEIITFAYDYGTQVSLDWQAFVAAKNNGTPLF